MKAKQSKYADIVSDVREANPTADNSELSKLISARIKLTISAPESLEPMNTKREITDTIRSHARSVVQRKKGLLVRFIRPGEPKLAGAVVNLAAKTIKNVYNKRPPIGALVAFTNGSDVLIGWSKYNKAHEVVAFTKKDAKLIAIERALADGLKPGPDGCYVTSNDVVIPNAINSEVDAFSARALSYFKGNLKNVILM